MRNEVWSCQKQWLGIGHEWIDYRVYGDSIRRCGNSAICGGSWRVFSHLPDFIGFSAFIVPWQSLTGGKNVAIVVAGDRIEESCQDVVTISCLDFR